MEEEADITLAILKDEKKSIIEQIKNATDIETKTKLLDLLMKIDENINKTNNNKDKNNIM